MARGDCEKAFGEAAARDGVVLQGGRRHSWLTERGYVDLPAAAGDTVEVLRRIFLELGGDERLLASARSTRLPNDYLHPETRTLVEVDEKQHFNAFRRRSLELYPTDVPLGFDRQQYLELCGPPKSPLPARTGKRPAGAFGPGGRDRQRAYNDALRDLGAVALGQPPVVRAAAVGPKSVPDRDKGVAAWMSVRGRFNCQA